MSRRRTLAVPTVYMPHSPRLRERLASCAFYIFYQKTVSKWRGATGLRRIQFLAQKRTMRDPFPAVGRNNDRLADSCAKSKNCITPHFKKSSSRVKNSMRMSGALFEGDIEI